MAEEMENQAQGAQGTQQQVQVLVDERDMKTVYANAYRIHTAEQEAVVDFGFNMPNPNAQQGQQQVLLKVTIAIEHVVAGFFKKRPGGFMKFMRFFCAWLVLFGSKFVILEALTLAVGDQVHFSGVFHGIITLIIVVVVMLLVEEVIVRFYRRLGPKADGPAAA